MTTNNKELTLQEIIDGFIILVESVIATKQIISKVQPKFAVGDEVTTRWGAKDTVREVEIDEPRISIWYGLEGDDGDDCGFAEDELELHVRYRPKKKKE